MALSILVEYKADDLTESAARIPALGDTRASVSLLQSATVASNVKMMITFMITNY